MEFFSYVLVILGGIVVFYILLKPRTASKSAPQKQAEIRQMYKDRLSAELSGITHKEERQTKKIALLKVFAKELEHNLFFNQEDVKGLLKELATY